MSGDKSDNSSSMISVTPKKKQEQPNIKMGKLSESGTAVQKKESDQPKYVAKTPPIQPESHKEFQFNSFSQIMPQMQKQKEQEKVSKKQELLSNTTSEGV